MTGLVMLKGIFSKGTAYLGLPTGSLAIVAPAGSFVAPSLSAVTIILAHVLTIIWVLSVGRRLFRLGEP